MNRSKPLALSTFAFALGVALGAAACGSAPSPATPAAAPAAAPPAAAAPAPAPATPAAVVKAPGDAKIGDTTKCPVSGEEFVVAATSPKTEHDGKTYYFCCGGCKKKFEAEPGKYAKKG